MNERIHRVLDGELSQEELTPEERVKLAEYRATLSAAEDVVPRHAAPDLTGAVMARIRRLEASGSATAAASPNALRRALEWLWTPRPVALRPAWAFGAAVLALALLVGVGDRAGGDPAGVAPPAATAAAAPAQIYVSFRLDAPDANSVRLAGDFTEWQPAYELHESRPGVWTVTVPLRAGVHDYAFVIDGERWTPDPLATAVDDGFGGQNSRLSILPPERIQA